MKMAGRIAEWEIGEDMARNETSPRDIYLHTLLSAIYHARHKTGFAYLCFWLPPASHWQSRLATGAVPRRGLKRFQLFFDKLD